MSEIVAISKIVIGERKRTDLGDIKSLAESIASVGLLNPLTCIRGAHDTYRLVAGLRRLRACKSLGWEKVPVTIAQNVDDAVQELQAERDENTCRKDFTPSEAVALGAALEQMIAAENAERQKAQGERGQEGGRGKKKEENPSSDSDEGFSDNAASRRTDARTAEAVGMKRDRYAKAKAVVEAAREDPEKFGGLVEQMDKTGNVNKAYRAVSGPRKKEPAANHEAPTTARDGELPTAATADAPRSVDGRGQKIVSAASEEAFRALDFFEQLDRWCAQGAKMIDQLGKMPGGEMLRDQALYLKCTTRAGQQIEHLRCRGLEKLRRDLWRWRPYAAACPYCGDRPNQQCRVCCGLPYVVEDHFNRSGAEAYFKRIGAQTTTTNAASPPSPEKPLVSRSGDDLGDDLGDDPPEWVYRE